MATRSAAAIALAIGLLAIPEDGLAKSSEGAEIAPAYSSWFRYKKSVADHWEIKGFADDPYKVRVGQKVAERMTSGKIVCLLADSGWKYLSSGLWTRDYEEIEEDVATVLWW